nr:hypothetical protein [uncultured Flavobacterium sp.]
MKKILPIALIFIMCSTAQSQTITLGQAINKADRQRSIAFRMAKDYLLIGSGIRAEDITEDLEGATTTFNENLHDLNIYAKSQDLKDALKLQESIWLKFRTDVFNQPESGKALDIMNAANALSNACNIVLQKIEATSSNTKAIKVFNTCGNQRSDLHRFAMLYTAKYWGTPYPDLNKELAQCQANIDNNIATLMTVPENTTEINNLLKFQLSEWMFLKKSLGDLSNLKPGTVYSSSKLMIKDILTLSGLYEKQITN